MASIKQRKNPKTRHTRNRGTSRSPFNSSIALKCVVLALATLWIISLVVFFFYLRTTPNQQTATRALPNEKEAVNHISKLLLAGDTEKALNETLTAVETYPANADLAMLLADAYAIERNHSKALPAYQRVTALPASTISQKTKAWTWMGVCNRRLGHKDEEHRWLHHAVTHGTPGRETYFHLVTSFQMELKYVEALVWHAFIFEDGSRHSDDYRQLSYLLSSVGHFDLQVIALESCLQSGTTCFDDEQYPEYRVHLQLSVALDETGRSEEAREHMKQAMELADEMTVEEVEREKDSYLQDIAKVRAKFQDLPEGETAMGALYEELSKRYEPLLRDTKRPPAWSIVKKWHVERFQWPIPDRLVEEAKATMRKQQGLFAMNGIGSVDKDELVTSFTCLTLPVYTLEDCIFSARVSATRLRNAVENDASVIALNYDDFPREDYPDLVDDDQPLHVGVFSADVRGHPMLALLSAFFKYTHPLSNIKVTLYHSSADPQVLEQMTEFVDDTFSCSKPDYIKCVEHARHNKVQLWLETSGNTGSGISSIAAAGPAPVGVIWAGFPGSMAMPSTLQYMVSDRYTVPPDGAVAKAYPEKMLYVPGSWMIADPSVVDDMATSKVNSTRSQLRQQYDIADNAAAVYCYFGRSWKIDDTIFDAWVRITQQVPNSYLVMLHYQGTTNEVTTPKQIQDKFQTAWKKNGLAKKRLIIVPPFKRGEHIQVMKQLCDIALDTSLYGGGTTSYDALYAGLPMVHYSDGCKMMQRAGGSILTSAGLPELIAKSFDEYVDVAVRLGTDKMYYSSIKDRLSNAIAGDNDAILFRPQTAIESMVRGLRQAYQIWKNGDPPRAILTDKNEKMVTTQDDREDL